MPLTRDQMEQAEELESQGVDLATCLNCNQMFPPTAEYWFFTGNKRSNWCKDCTRDTDKDRDLRPIPEELLRKIVSGDVLESGALEHLRDDVMNVFGGPRGFAAVIRQEFDGCKVGSNARVQLLKMVANLTVEADKRRGRGLQEDVSSEDLMRVLEHVVGKQSK